MQSHRTFWKSLKAENQDKIAKTKKNDQMYYIQLRNRYNNYTHPQDPELNRHLGDIFELKGIDPKSKGKLDLKLKQAFREQYPKHFPAAHHPPLWFQRYDPERNKVKNYTTPVPFHDHYNQHVQIFSFPPYDSNYWAKPWAAVVHFFPSPNPKCYMRYNHWYQVWNPDRNDPMQEGILSLEMKTGDVVLFGQKCSQYNPRIVVPTYDDRNYKVATSGYFVVLSDEDIVRCNYTTAREYSQGLIGLEEVVKRPFYYPTQLQKEPMWDIATIRENCKNEPRVIKPYLKTDEEMQNDQRRRVDQKLPF